LSVSAAEAARSLHIPSDNPPAWLRVAIPLVTGALLFVVRVRGVSRDFWLLGDQIRDWGIALGSLGSLPLIGPATHVHGYTIGPAFYWILWAIRVVVGPWFHNLPHAGGIGQALLQSAADVLLLTGVWKRTRSVWLALTTVVLVATGPFDLALSAIIWNPLMGSMLAKTATALILLDWHRGSTVRMAITAAIAWSAVHAYTGAIFVALSIFAALLAGPCVRRDWPTVWRRGLVIAAVVAALQIPYAIHQLSTGFSESAMGAVTDSLRTVLSGRANVRLAASAAYYAGALATIQSNPWPVRAWVWILLCCSAALAVRYRNDPALLAVTLLPQVAAITGYALWLNDLDHYYYLSLAPALVLTIVLGAAAFAPRRLEPFAGIALFIAALTIVPLRLREAAPMLKMPQYGVLVAGSREIVKRGEPMQSIEPEFVLPATSDPEFIFRILGGRIDRQAPWRAVISPDGKVRYINSQR
jgi:hypothetical protein